MSAGISTPKVDVGFYSKILERQGVTEAIENVGISECFSPSGDGSGDVTTSPITAGLNKAFVTIEFKGETDKEPLHLFMKKRPTNSEDSRAKAFDREVFFYSVFLPEAVAFSEKRDEFKEIKLADYFAKCYHADKDVILLENLLKSGFFMTPVLRPHTFYQAEKVFEALGTFHAVSHCMIKEMGLEEFQKKYSALGEDSSMFLEKNAKMYEKQWENILEMAFTVLKHGKVSMKAEAAADYLIKYKGKVFAELCDQVKIREEDRLATLNFGDIWNRNVFVLRDENLQRYPRAVIINVKNTRIGSPMLDVGCYMYSCVMDHVRLSNWKYMLAVYLEFLRDCSEEMGAEFVIELDVMKTLYFGKTSHGIFRALNFLFRKFYSDKAVDNFHLTDFEHWLKDNPESYQVLAKETAAKIDTYAKGVAELTELD